MLRELNIENFALVERLRLEFEAGFSVLTGETGAGKSILVDALGAVLGDSLGAEVIRAGADRARLSALLDSSPALDALLAEAGLEADSGPGGQDGLLLLGRQIAPDRSYYHVNGRPATRALVRDLGELLVDLHGQHEHQTLLREATHLDFLDAFAGETLTAPLAAYAEAFAAFRALVEEERRLQAAERDRAQRVDLLSFQVKEIEAAAFTPEEEESLPLEHARLAHAEKLQAACAEVLAALDGEYGTAPGVAAAAGQAAVTLQSVAAYDPALAPLVEELRTADTVLRETSRSLSAYVAGLEADPRRLGTLEDRLALLERLKRKYGASVAEILAYGDAAARELAELEELDLRREQIAAELAAARERAGAAGEKLSAARRKAARALEQAVVAEIRELGMEHGEFSVEFSRVEDPQGLPDRAGARQEAGPRGLDRVRFLLSANAGEPLRPLAAVASGGELSRLMLALKSLCSAGTVPTLVFDEVDVGIGGVVAHAVARKLSRLSASAQVLCVTHLAQIASVADRQVQVHKGLAGERTTISARTLAEEERAAELARMMGAQTDQQTALRHAEEMLAAARAAPRAPGGA